MLILRHCSLSHSLSPDSVDTSQDNLFDGPPEPAPGAPLLTETDSKFLSSFFEDMTSNQYNMPSFGEGLNFSDAWLDLPPQFMGSSTSFGPQETSAAGFGLPNDQHNDQHSDQHNDLSRMLCAGSSLSMMPPPPPPPPQQSQPQSFHPPQQQQQQQHSDDVLNAAATLLQNGSHASPSTSKSNGNDSGSIGNSDQDSSRHLGGYSVGQLRHQPMEEFKEENRRSGQFTEANHTFTRWMWGSKEKTTVTKPAVGDIQWGSDASFSDIQGYVPDTTKEPSVESMHQNQMKYLGGLEAKQGATNSRPASPASLASLASPVIGRATSSNGDGPVCVKREEDASAPPRKRRKSKIVVRSTTAEEEDDDQDDAASTRSPGRKRKTKSERSASGSEPPSETTGPGRRRRSGANTAKPPRENLSEEQKRENHIRSEQKRRTLIKEGFDDLGELIPGLKGGGFSKSTTLNMAADWLEHIIQGNKVLAVQAGVLEKS